MNPEDELGEAMRLADIEFSRAKVLREERQFSLMNTAINKAIRYMEVARTCIFDIGDLVA